MNKDDKELDNVVPDIAKHRQKFCHRCDHAEEVQRGKYSNMPYDQTPCSKCFTIQSTRTTDATNKVLDDLMERVELPEPTMKGSFYNCLCVVLREFMGIAPIDREIIILRLSGMKWKHVVKRINKMFNLVKIGRPCTISSLNKRLKRVCTGIQKRPGRPIIASLLYTRGRSLEDLSHSLFNEGE